VLDGSKALQAAANELFGPVPVHRCVRHTERNLLEHPRERDRPPVKAGYASGTVTVARVKSRRYGELGGPLQLERVAVNSHALSPGRRSRLWSMCSREKQSK
jgi:hypothetical protein